MAICRLGRQSCYRPGCCSASRFWPPALGAVLHRGGGAVHDTSFSLAPPAPRRGRCGDVTRRTRVGGFTEQSAVTLEFLEDLGHKARQSELLLPVETALDDIPELAVTAEDAFRLKQGRAIVLVPRQVESVKARLKPGSRTVSAMAGGSVVALCEMRAGRLEPSRVFNLEKSGD